MNFERPLVRSLKTMLSLPTSVIHVLIGPRQVGKTTIARQIEKSFTIPVLYATADSPLPPDAAWIETQWRRVTAAASSSGGPVLLILDEVQKVMGWSEVVKFLWDTRPQKPEIRLLILGSSALLMQEGLTESLAGRFFLHRCPHWAFPETREAFGWNLNQWLFFGGYPGGAPFISDETNWKRYITDSLIETVLARDVLQMTKIIKPALLRHLFTLAATMPSQIVSYTKMVGQLQDAGNTTTLAHYLKLLESAFLVSGLEVFSLGFQRKRGSSPKLILWNNALVNALSTRTLEESLADPVWWGRLVENAVGGHLCNHLNSVEYTLAYWRDRNQEVDFVISRGKDVWAIEVKSGRSGKNTGLQRFWNRYPKVKTLMVGGNGIPLEEFFGKEPTAFLS
jgi:predicted AAA+ superfamily ATPase